MSTIMKHVDGYALTMLIFTFLQGEVENIWQYLEVFMIFPHAPSPHSYSQTKMCPEQTFSTVLNLISFMGITRARWGQV